MPMDKSLQRSAEDERMIFRWDPCGILCCLLTYAAVLYADYVVVNWLVLPTFDGRSHPFSLYLSLFSRSMLCCDICESANMQCHVVPYGSMRVPVSGSWGYAPEWRLCLRIVTGVASRLDGVWIFSEFFASLYQQNCILYISCDVSYLKNIRIDVILFIVSNGGRNGFGVLPVPMGFPWPRLTL